MRRRGTTSGFSLLEVLVALAILGMTVSVIFGGMSKAVKAVRLIDDTERRIELGRQKLAEIELLDGLKDGESAYGQFPDGTGWRVETSSFIAPINGSSPNPNAVVRIALRLEWLSGQTAKSWNVDTYRFVPSPAPATASLQSQLDALR
jgi:general secretion pathway protein I